MLPILPKLFLESYHQKNFKAPLNEFFERIKNFAINFFTKIKYVMNHDSKTVNLKVVAMISCLSLLSLLVFSMLRIYPKSLVVPPTPHKSPRKFFEPVADFK